MLDVAAAIGPSKDVGTVSVSARRIRGGVDAAAAVSPLDWIERSWCDICVFLDRQKL